MNLLNSFISKQKEKVKIIILYQHQRQKLMRNERKKRKILLNKYLIVLKDSTKAL